MPVMVVEWNASWASDHAQVLLREIEILKTQLEPEGTGHIHTAIAVLEHRVQALTSGFED